MKGQTGAGIVTEPEANGDVARGTSMPSTLRCSGQVLVLAFCIVDGVGSE